MPPSSKSPAGTEGNILLVEEYDALAAAIGSALKKFAPRHAVRVARAFPAPTELAAGPLPDLVIIDFDPPLPGALEFLYRLRKAAPATRAMIIAAGMPRDTSRVRGFPTALIFIEKPFQLEELGAAVEALLHLDATGDTNVPATLRDLNLADVIPLLCLERVTEAVRVAAADGESVGEIHFTQGQIQHASARGLQGIDALREMFRWESPDIAVTESDSETVRSIDGNWPTVLDTVLSSIPRREAGQPRTATSGAKKTPTPIARDGKKVLVIDDTEMLRVFVDEMLSTADPRMQIVCAADGTEGLRACASFQPDLILLDYSLPDFNGDEVCRRLFENKETRDIPVIMMSGHVAQMAETAAVYENVVLTLSKPFVSAALVVAVTKALSKPVERKPRKLPSADGNSAETEHQTDSRPPTHEPISVEATPTVAPAPAPVLTPALIPAASGDAVVLSIALEVVSMKLSPTLQIAALRTRSVSPAVLLHVDPRAMSAVRFPDAAFEIAQVELDALEQIHLIHIVPASRPAGALRPHTGVPVERLAVLPANGSGGIQITPASGAHMTIQLLLAFDLAGVELSPTFGVSYFVLRARSGRARVVLPGQRGKVGIVFETARVLLDSAARIAEVSLDSVVR